MNLRVVSAFFASLGLVFPLAPAAAEQRVALVISNGAYEKAAELSNTRNDAADITEALKAVGFDVTEGTDLTKTAMDSKIREFAVVRRSPKENPPVEATRRGPYS